jgi:hypothetical protein
MAGEGASSGQLVPHAPGAVLLLEAALLQGIRSTIAATALVGLLVVTVRAGGGSLMAVSSGRMSPMAAAGAAKDPASADMAGMSGLHTLLVGDAD